MRIRAPKEGSCDPTVPLELPYSLHAFHRVSSTDKLNVEWMPQISYAFHSEQKLHPEIFRNPFYNQSMHSKLGCKQGWFCYSQFHSSSWNIAQLTKVKIMKRQGHWEDLHIPHSIRSIVCLNLPSFSGGLDPWGKPNTVERNEFICCIHLNNW